MYPSWMFRCKFWQNMRVVAATTDYFRYLPIRSVTTTSKRLQRFAVSRSDWPSIVLVVVRDCHPYAKRAERWQKYDSHNFMIDKRGDVPRISAVLAILYCGYNQSKSLHISSAKLWRILQTNKMYPPLGVQCSWREWCRRAILFFRFSDWFR